MTARILDGKALAQSMRTELAVQLAARCGKRPPGLAAVLVGNNPASLSYIRNKQKACKEVGIVSRLDHLPSEISQADLLQKIAELNSDPSYHGILIQLPLPKHISEEAVIDAVGPWKDVDCFHPENVGRVAIGHPRYYPCTPYGCIELARRNGVVLAGRNVVVVGRSNIVGKPLAMMLMQKPTATNPAGSDATVTVAHTKTADLAEVCRRADVVFAAAGQAHLIKASMIQPGAAVIDVGTNPTPEGKLVGDVDPAVAQVAGWLSPVPGGVGPMTITMLLMNVARAALLIDG